MIKTFCDICGTEIKQNESLYSVNLQTKKATGFYIAQITENKDEVCYSCATALRTAIRERSK